MKRSLALGALMAFVITGSVWASDITSAPGSSPDWELIDGVFTRPVAGSSNNSVVINSDSEIVYRLAGGHSASDDECSNENTINITSGILNRTVIGGSAKTANENTVIVDSGTFKESIYGGAWFENKDSIGKGTTANENTVVINGGTFSEYSNIYGGSGKTANENTVIINGGVFNGASIIGGGAHFLDLMLESSISANDNKVVINGGSFGVESSVIGGYGKETKNNTINISGVVDLEKVNFFGGVTLEGYSDIAQSGGKDNPNTLKIGWDAIADNVSAWSGTIGSAQGFDIINIYEGSNATFKTALNDANVAVNVNGATWNVDKASTVGSANFDASSVLVLKGEGKQFTKAGDYALNGTGTLTVEQGAKLTIEGIDNNTYNIAKGFENITDAKDKWDVTDLNTLMQGTWSADEDNGLQLEIKAKEAEDIAEDMGVSTSTAQSIANVTAAAQQAQANGFEADANGIGEAKAVAFVEAMSGVDSKVAGQVFEAVSKMAEAGGNSATAANIVKNVTGVTNDRLSFNCGHSAPHKGGHGVGLLEEGSGADVWVEYIHGKDKVEDMPSSAGASSYEGQYNGIVMGVDFKKVNKFQSGIAFNYGEGDTNSVGSAARTHSDYDFWGIGYYGNIHNDNSNVIFDIGYAKTDSDVENTNATGVSFKASPETTTWTAGVKVEKLYQNENVQIVPYTGLRFMSIDPEDYTTECASSKYQMERQNVWLLPLGVSIKQEIANDNGWTVSPRVDLSYIWAFGDTDSEMEFSTLGTKTPIQYEVMDDGSWLGLVGIEAHKGQWGFGVNYSYQKGDHSESKKWYVDVNYSF